MGQGPGGNPGHGGGKAKNLGPDVVSFSQVVPISVREAGDAEILQGEVWDKNGEADLDVLRIDLAGTATASFSRTITAADRAQAIKPLAFDAEGWKVWDAGAAGDGHLSFEFQYTYAERGTHNWSLVVLDDDGATGTSGVVSVDVYEWEVFADPVDHGGNVLAGAQWGQWLAEPGATANATNYVKIVNGATEVQPFLIDFTDGELVGVEDGNWSIPLAGEIRYSYWEGPAGAGPPDFGQFTDDGLSVDGTAVLTFTGKGNVMYVHYALELPLILADQDYAGAFTVTRL